MRPCGAIIGFLTTASLPSILGQVTPANSTNPESPHGNIEAIWHGCPVPDGGLSKWYYVRPSNGPYQCDALDDPWKWNMLAAYRSGGQEGVHRKYTDDVNDSACMTNWVYYSSDGETSLGVIGRTTTQGDTRRWCALPVYRQGGVQNKQWAYCLCLP